MNRNKQTFLNYFVSRSREGVLVFPFSNTKKTDPQASRNY